MKGSRKISGEAGWPEAGGRVAREQPEDMVRVDRLEGRSTFSRRVEDACLEVCPLEKLLYTFWNVRSSRFVKAKWTDSESEPKARWQKKE